MVLRERRGGENPNGILIVSWRDTVFSVLSNDDAYIIFILFIFFTANFSSAKSPKYVFVAFNQDRYFFLLRLLEK